MDLRHGHGEVGSDLNRHDLNLTSTGRGHYFSQGYYFPPSNFRVSILLYVFQWLLKLTSLVQLCPTRGPHAPHTKVLCGPV